jgi:hypothetical protein
MDVADPPPKQGDSQLASLSLFAPTLNLALTMSDNIEDSLASLKLKINLQCFM